MSDLMLFDLLPKDDESIDLMEQRAQLLAISKAAVSADADTNLVCFTLGSSSTYAVNFNDVIELLDNVSITSIPGAPSLVSGITNWRGMLIMVIDIATLLGINDDCHRSKKKVIVLRCNKQMFALSIIDVIGDHAVLMNNCVTSDATGGVNKYVIGLFDNHITLLNLPNLYQNIINLIQTTEKQS